MSRLGTSLALGAGALLLLAACAPPPVDEEAMNAWRVEQDAAANSWADLAAALSANLNETLIV